MTDTPDPAPRCVHYVGFRDDAYVRAFRIWGGPRFIHRCWDRRARRDIGEVPEDFAESLQGG